MEDASINREIALKELLMSLSMFLIADLLNQTISNIKNCNVNNTEEIYNYQKMIVEFSKSTKESFLELKAFLFTNVYKNYQVNRITHKTQTVIRDLFNHFMNNPKILPKSWQEDCNLNSEILLSEIVTNYIAGMTDRFAIIEHKKIFDLYHY